MATADFSVVQPPDSAAMRRAVIEALRSEASLHIEVLGQYSVPRPARLALEVAIGSVDVRKDGTLRVSGIATEIQPDPAFIRIRTSRSPGAPAEASIVLAE
jgi:hypothetical protein